MRVRRVFGDEAAVQIDDDDIIRWINDAQIEIVTNNDSALQKTDFVNLVAAQGTYILPTDLLVLRSLRYKFSDMLSFSALRYKNMQEFDNAIDGWDGAAYTNSSPIYFTMYEGKAILFPVPDRSATAGLKVLYNQKPADVAVVGDSLALPSLYHNTIFRYCMWQASLLDEDLEPAMMYQNTFQQGLVALANNETKDPVETYPTITVMEFDA
jgi:hypothetical protein